MFWHRGRALADRSGASLLAGLGEGDKQVERSANRFWQGEGRKIQGLHEAVEDTSTVSRQRG